MSEPKYVAAGFTADLETLLTKFVDSNTLRFSRFSEIWREMKLSLIFMGREIETEMLEFIGESFRLTQLAIKKEEPEARKVGSLYTLYGLYHKQPINPKAKIRVSIDTWIVLTDLVNQANQEGHMDVVYIFKKLYLSGAFHFVSTPSLMGPRSTLLKYQTPSANVMDSLSAQPKFASAMLETGRIKELSLLHQKYQEMKEKSGHPLIQSLKLVEDVGVTLSSVLEGMTNKPSLSDATTSEETSWSEGEEETIQSRRSALRKMTISASASKSRTKHSRIMKKEMETKESNK